MRIITMNSDGTYSTQSWQFNNFETPSDTVYSDRLYQWSPNNYADICQQVFGNQGQYWGNRSSDKIELFLQYYLDKPNLVLCKVEQLENKSNGYPYWRFDYKLK